MTVSELITALQAIEDKTLEVAMASDPECNTIRLLTEVDAEKRNFIEDGECIEVGYAKLTKALRKEGYTREDCISDSDADGSCILLAP